MSETTRKALYGLIPAITALLIAYGILTSTLAVLWGNVAVLAVGFGYAASRATGNRVGDPQVRRYLYVLAPAVVALIGGYWSLDVGLWTSLVMAVLGACLAGLNVDPDEQGTDAGLGILDDQPAKLTGNTERKPKRSLRVAIATNVMALLAVAGLPLSTTPAHAAIGDCSTWVTTYSGFAGVTIYRGHLACYGKLPGALKEYRSKIFCKKFGQTGRVIFGGWKKEGSGKDSYNSCPWPWQVESKYDVVIQTR